MMVKISALFEQWFALPPSDNGKKFAAAAQLKATTTFGFLMRSKFRAHVGGHTQHIKQTSAIQDIRHKKERNQAAWSLDRDIPAEAE